MSTSISDSFPSSLALLGGIPTKHPDLAVSIAVVIIYVAITPVALWRISSKASRCFALIRPVVFIIVRIITFVIRAIQAHGTYTKGLFIAEQILLLCGFVLLCEPLVTLLGYHIMRYVHPSPSKSTTELILKLLRVALIVALALGGYAGSKFGDTNNSSTLKTVKTLRDVNTFLCLVITALCAIVVIIAHFKEALPARQTLFIVIVSALLTVASVYKIVLYHMSPPPSLVNTGPKVAFYLLNSLPELLVSILYLCVNMRTAFDIDEARRKEKERKEMRQGDNDTPGSSYNMDPRGKPGRYEYSA